MKLNTPVGILSSGGTSPNYTFNLIFQNASNAKFLRVGDHVTSGVNGNIYEIVSWVGQPNDYVSNTQVTANFVNVDEASSNDSGYNSIVNTPSQVHPESPFLDEGVVGNISIFSGQDFEWNLTYSATNNLESSQAVVGDYISDSNGNSFEISFIGNNGLGDPIKVVEVTKNGVGPFAGNATIYRPTPNYKLFNGGEINSIAHNILTNKDRFIVDFSLNQVANQSGGGSNGDWQQIHYTLTASDITNKGFTMNPTPLVPSEVGADLIPSVSLLYGQAFTITGGNFFTWNGLELDGFVNEGDTIRLLYFSQ